MGFVTPVYVHSLAQTAWKALPGRVRERLLWLFPVPLWRAGVVAIIENKRGEVLLLRHRFRGARTWGLPGGWLEPREDPARGMCRELAEELGLRLEPRDLELVTVRSRAQRRHVEVFYRLRLDLVDVPSGFEFDEHGYFPLGSLPDSMLSAHRDLLVEIMGRGAGGAACPP